MSEDLLVFLKAAGESLTETDFTDRFRDDQEPVQDGDLRYLLELSLESVGSALLAGVDAVRASRAAATAPPVWDKACTCLVSVGPHAAFCPCSKPVPSEGEVP